MLILFDCDDILEATERALEDDISDKERAEYMKDLEFYTRCENGINVCNLEEFSQLLIEAEKHCTEIRITDGGTYIYLEA